MSTDGTGYRERKQMERAEVTLSGTCRLSNIRDGGPSAPCVQVVLPRMETERRGTELANEGLAPRGGVANSQRQRRDSQKPDLRISAGLEGG